MIYRAVQLVAVLSLLSLSGCGPDKSTQLARCEQDGLKVYASLAHDPLHDSLVGGYVGVCMEAHGYVQATAKTLCARMSRGGAEQLDPKCYERE